MCGIAGIVRADPRCPVDPAVVCAMTDLLRHRGPDSCGFHFAPGIGLGVRRLSLIDLHTGDQPFSTEDGSVSLVCNGEIYNHQELREALLARGHRFRSNSDVEVIAHLYEDHGEQCLQRLRGMFAFALWDQRRRRLMLARDRLGIKPLHYARTADGLCFGSEQKAVLLADESPREMDPASLRDLFTVGFITGSKTLFRRIRRVPPGSYLLYSAGALSFHTYWELDFPRHASRATRPRRTRADWAEEVRTKVEECVRLHLRGDVPVGAWLSAGLDSSGLVSLMARLTGRRVEAYGLSFEEGCLDELSHQKTLADFPEYDVSHQRIVLGKADFERLPQAVWHCEDPFTAGLEVLRLVLAEAASRRVKVVMSGEGADEVFGGYPWYRGSRILRALGALPLPLRRAACRWQRVGTRWPGAARILSSPGGPLDLDRFSRFIGAPGADGVPLGLFSPDARVALRAAEAGRTMPLAPPGIGEWHPFHQLQYYDLRVRLADNVVHHLDRGSMAHSLEVRVPYLDHELVELSTRIPPGLQMRGLQEKHLLRRALGQDLPREIARRRKRGLRAPFREWFLQDLPGFARDLLSEGALRETGIFDPPAVSLMLERHRSRREDVARLLLGILGTQLWDHLFRRGSLSTRAIGP